MNSTTDLLIVGAGIAGLATAWWLTREQEGLRIVLVERSARLGTGSSGRSAAILRTFGPDPVTNTIARAGARWLREPGALGPAALQDPCGLVLGADGEAAGAMRRWLAMDVEGEGRILEAREAGNLLPHLNRIPELALHFPREGRIEVATLLERLARALRQSDAELRTGTGVGALLCSAGRVEGALLEDGGEIRARNTVLAAGGWAGALGQRAGSAVELRPTRRHLLTTETQSGVDPHGPVVWLEDVGVYLRPEQGGLLACACDSEPWDPECAQPFAVDPRQEARVHAAANAVLRAPLAPSARFWSGIRTLTHDDRFAVGPDPHLANLFWVAGLGGHGMTAGLEVGRLAARQLLGKPVDALLGRALDPARLVRAQEGAR